jgi:hypothetical protein
VLNWINVSRICLSIDRERTLQASDDSHIFKCNGCRKIMIDEEFNSHLCTPLPTGDAETLKSRMNRIEE